MLRCHYVTCPKRGAGRTSPAFTVNSGIQKLVSIVCKASRAVGVVSVFAVRVKKNQPQNHFCQVAHHGVICVFQWWTGMPEPSKAETRRHNYLQVPWN